MINQEVANYIDENKLCSEYIFEDCNKFIDFLYTHGGRISAILWWDYCKITEGSSIGSGGYKDTRNLEFMFAETQIYEDELEGKSAIEIKKYISDTQKIYSTSHLIPSFYLVE